MELMGRRGGRSASGVRRQKRGLRISALLAGVLVVGVLGSGGVRAGTPGAASTDVPQTSAGAHHTCALTTDGGVKCWGYNAYGQLGDGTTKDRGAPDTVSGLGSGVTGISAGYGHTCALTTAGGVRCWGNNDAGQLGDGTKTNRHTPVDVAGLASGMIQVSAGERHTCALTGDGGIKCWGFNNGRLGDGTNTSSSSPVDVVGLASGAIQVAAGKLHTCALTGDGGVQCWGNNGAGQLGDGTTTNSKIPVTVQGLTSEVTAISTSGEHTCALTAAGTVTCWGKNDAGQVGDGTTTNRSTPVDVTGLTSGVKTISAGTTHTCAVTTAGGVRCWGHGGSGRLGNGGTTNQASPVDVTGLASGVAAVSAGTAHTCVATTAGGAKCWGSRSYGQLGDGTIGPVAQTTSVDVIELVERQPQTIDFPTTPAKVLYGAPKRSLGATATSGLPVTYTPQGACLMDGTTAITYTKAGMCTIEAKQTGNTLFLPAPPVTRTITVAPAKTATKVTVKPGAVRSGTTVTLTAVVTRQNVAAVGTITGKVTFKIGGKQVASTNLATNGKAGAKVRITGKAGAKVAVQVSYVGGGNFAASASKPVKITIKP